jgi:hypothetical protein
MSLEIVSAALKAAAAAAIDSIKADKTKMGQAKTDLLAAIDAELGRAAVELTDRFDRVDAKAARWESRHLLLLNLVAFAGWVAFASLLFLQLHR